MKLIKEHRLIFAEVQTNNNKFWNGKLYDDGSVVTEWGRIGMTSQSKTFPNEGERFLTKKMNEKLKKGYTELKVVSDAPLSSKTVDKGALQRVARDNINVSCPTLTALIDRLVKHNVHTITSNTSITYNAATGLFSTPLGIVTLEGITEARDLLAEIKNSSVRNDSFFKNVSKYLRIIPRDLGMKINKDSIFINPKEFDDQLNILDSLESSYAVITKAPERTNDSSDVPEKIFNVTINTLTDSSQWDRIVRNFESTNKSTHGYTHRKIKNIYVLDIHEMTKNFDEKLGSIIEVYHGTSGANVLSIMKDGLKTSPPSTASIAGKAFGNGIYGATCASKSLGYTFGRWGGSTTDFGYMFICDFAMGKSYYPNTVTSHIPSGYDSCYALAAKTGFLNDELIVYKNNQVRIKYLLEIQ